ncbi:MAG: tRNA (guanosine(37)-N1)-methyltransferase TrmD [Spirochaetes bacterium]|uniref:tRNA (guanine-N(1)-)-methyltransferase n=1 Tax=Candidatus Ornithospirochaeta stercoravium TaxID=2840897 RepID=A0A9D9NCM4_9SPIO|nr:tRNA (guanosine(37)-N1)-methyltransferase TrmD [Candidatus Ornithospirochaeta stercoravium]
MKITIFTLFPEMIRPFFTSSIMKRAVDKGIVEYEIVNFRDYAEGVHKKADDLPYGGGAGMVIMPEPLSKALDDYNATGKRVIFPTPSGKTFTEKYAEELSNEDELVFICGHYEGIDQRVIDTYVTDEITIGDYVLSSGETSTIVIIDALFRLIDGVITEESLEDESFNSSLLEYPQYTRPPRYCTKSVPDVLLTGHHGHITQWRCDQRLVKTMLNRPDLLSHASLSTEERERLLKILDSEDKRTCQRWILSEL